MPIAEEHENTKSQYSVKSDMGYPTFDTVNPWFNKRSPCCKPIRSQAFLSRQGSQPGPEALRSIKEPDSSDEIIDQFHIIYPTVS